MTVTATVEFDGLDKEAARRCLVAAGFTVTRVAVKGVPAGNVTPMTPGQRASAVTDLPEGLDEHERRAYVRGYAKGAVTFSKSNPPPSGNEFDGWESVPVLTWATQDGGWTPQPATSRTARRQVSEAEATAWKRLRWAVIQYEWDRHPACHKAAMTELRKWQTHWAAYQADVAARRAAKAPKRKRKGVAA